MSTGGIDVALSQSTCAHQSGEPGLVFAPKLTDLHRRPGYARPFEPHPSVVLGAISWAFIAKSYQNLQKTTFD